MEKETQNKARRVTTSEGDQVVTAKQEEPKEEPTVNAKAKEALDEEDARLAEEAKARAEQDAENEEAFRVFLESR